MKLSRRISTMAALITLVSTLTAAPIALAANCEAGFVGPYGTVCGGEEQTIPFQFTVVPRFGELDVSVDVVDFDAFFKNIFATSRAVGVGDAILNGVALSVATRKTITPRDGQVSKVLVVPGNPTSVTVTGFELKGTKVEILLQASGNADREELGFRTPVKGRITLPTTTVQAGDSATYTLNEWTLGANGKVNYAKGLKSQQIVNINGTGVASGSTNQLSSS